MLFFVIDFSCMTMMPINKQHTEPPRSGGSEKLTHTVLKAIEQAIEMIPILDYHHLKHNSSFFRLYTDSLGSKFQFVKLHWIIRLIRLALSGSPALAPASGISVFGRVQVQVS